MTLVRNRQQLLNGNSLNKLLIYTCFLACQFNWLSLAAQTDSLEIHKIKGREYFIHVVEKGESLYSIHKSYNVPIEVIKKENPGVLDGLSISERIFIPVKKKIAPEIKKDGNYIIHTVLKKQTLYSISKLYQIKQKDIIATNPEISDGLREGQSIRIPLNYIQKETFEKPNTENSKFRTHVVKKGETFYSLSKFYKTTIDSIKLVNSGLEGGLKVEQTINIPRPADMLGDLKLTIEEIDVLLDSTNTKKGEYHVGLFLPFYLDKNDEIVRNLGVLDDKSIYPRSRFAVEFYQGFVTALDSLSSSQGSFKVHVYDTKGNDTLRAKELLMLPELKTFDLIVGPLYPNNFKLLIEFAKQNEIPIISPVKQRNKTLLGNQYIFKPIPSKSTNIDDICTLVVDSFKTENLLAIEYEGAKEKPMVDLYMQAYKDHVINLEDTLIYSPIEKIEISGGITGIVGKLKREKNNVIFVPVSGQVFVTKLFNHLIAVLNKVEYRDYRITLIGLEEWITYDNIDLDYFQRLNLHYFSSRFIDPEEPLVIDFIKNYVYRFDIYPSRNTLLGFDLAYYFGKNLLEYGVNFSSANLSDYKGLSIELNFFKTGLESGYENLNSYLLRFNRYTVDRIKY